MSIVLLHCSCIAFGEFLSNGKYGLHIIPPEHSISLHMTVLRVTVYVWVYKDEFGLEAVENFFFPFWYVWIQHSKLFEWLWRFYYLMPSKSAFARGARGLIHEKTPQKLYMEWEQNKILGIECEDRIITTFTWDITEARLPRWFFD